MRASEKKTELGLEEGNETSRSQPSKDKRGLKVENLRLRGRRGELLEATLLVVGFLFVLIFIWPGALLKQPAHKFICDQDPANPICSPAFREN